MPEGQGVVVDRGIQAHLPILVVGDVHGDLERLFQGLKPYLPESWHTLFLGDLVDGGMFGVGALRYARDRPNSTVLIGNHEVAMLRALRDPSAISFWTGMGGQLHDLQELRRDIALQEWLVARPALVRLPDGTLAQHSDNDGYGRLLDDKHQGDPVEAINAAVGDRLRRGRETDVFTLLTPQGIFRTQPPRLQSWLDRMGATRLIHGHTPHRQSVPDVYAGGLCIDYDGGLSRFTGRYRRVRPLAASIGQLPDPIPLPTGYP